MQREVRMERTYVSEAEAAHQLMLLPCRGTHTPPTNEGRRGCAVVIKAQGKGGISD